MDFPGQTLTTGKTPTGAAVCRGTPDTRKHAFRLINPQSPQHTIYPLLSLVKPDNLNNWVGWVVSMDYNGPNRPRGRPWAR
jgi:hypothetical protein